MNEAENNKGKAVAAVEAGLVKMKPKWQFVLQTVLLVIGTMLSCCVLLFLVSMVLFLLRDTGIWFVPGFGRSSLGLFFRSLPWLLIFLTIVFAIVLEILVRQYSIGYGKPLLYSAIGVVTIAIVGGVFIEMTPLHRGLRDRVPFMNNVYHRAVGTRNIVAGNIIDVSSTGFLINTPQNKEVLLESDKNTFILDEGDLQAGDAVVALVRFENQKNVIIRMRRISDDLHFPRMMGPGMMRRYMILPPPDKFLK